MRIIRTIRQLRKAFEKARQASQSVGFVPTMGAFHEGHLSLMRQSRKDCDFTVVSLFVNPTQFLPGEDLKKYPRDFKGDARLARREGVDILFAPSVEEMYPGKPLTYIEVEGVSEVLCGASRPGHFRGVATVVSKLVNIVQPDVMYFGQKDAQQVCVIRQMVRDLNMLVRVKVCPIVREPDGLAMSSRNKYLSPRERSEAAMIFRALGLAQRVIARGERSVKKITSQIKKLLLEETGASIDYISCVSTTDLKPVHEIKGEVLIAIAVKFSSARLIDNVIVKVHKRE